MLSLESLRKIDAVNTTHLTNEELDGIRKSFYDFGQLIFKDWLEQKFGSKYPVGSFTNEQDKHKMEVWKNKPQKQE
jgi:hypothetical protein